MLRAHGLRLVRSSAAVPPPVRDVQVDTRELADLMQRLAGTQPDVVRTMLRFARKMVDGPRSES